MFVASPTAANDLSVSTDTSTGTTVVPVPAIVGGTSGGVFVAIAVFLGWRWWVFFNGRSNRGDATQTPRVLRKKDPGVPTKLFGKESISSSGLTDEKDSTQGVGLSTVLIPQNAHEGARNTRIIEESSFMPRPAQIHTHLSRSFALAETNSMFKPSAHRLSKGLSYKASTVSTASMYSAQSAEEHQIRVPTAVILAALGPNLDATPSVAAGNMQSAALESVGEGSELLTSNRDNQYGPGIQQLVKQSNRLSHISNGSLNLQTLDHGPMLSPIGLAYGGEECV